MNPNSQIELAVDMRSSCCASKVEKALQEIAGIESVNVDYNRQSVMVKGDVIAEELKSTIEKKTGLYAVIMGIGSTSNKNLGSAVAAIAIGDSPVQGILRITQSDPDTCIIEGSLDKLPDSKNLYVSLHETGDLSKGCYSCGPPLSHEADKNDYIGIISQLKPQTDGSAQFRCTSSKLTVDDMYGHCVVIHDGDEQQVKDSQSSRLACGIVARSSGIFQNSKRFCACDGVAIWEEKKRRDSEKASP